MKAVFHTPKSWRGSHTAPLPPLRCGDRQNWLSLFQRADLEFQDGRSRLVVVPRGGLLELRSGLVQLRLTELDERAFRVGELRRRLSEDSLGSPPTGSSRRAISTDFARSFLSVRPRRC